MKTNSVTPPNSDKANLKNETAETGKSRYKLLKLLPKAVSAVNFQNPPFSPGRDKRAADHHVNNANKLKSHMNKGFSAPLVSIIPEEARGKSKSSNFETQEPTSPKVSCMGQIKHRKKLAKMKHTASMPKDVKPFSSPDVPKKELSSSEMMKKTKPASFLGIFGGAKRGRSKSSAAAAEKSNQLTDDASAAAPNLGQMKRFASGRERLANFDWTKAQMAPEDMDDDDHRRYHSDEEQRGEDDDDEEEEEVIIPFSAPILLGGDRPRITLEPRKEINLWKRRTMAPPRPLQLNTSY